MPLRILIFLLVAAGSYEAHSETYYTSKLLKDCQCTVSHCDFGRCEDKLGPQKKGELQGKFCTEQVEDHEVKCSSAKPEYAAYTMSFCPKDCVELAKTPSLSKSDLIKKYDETVHLYKEEYKKVLPPDLYSALEKERPLWQPVFQIDGVKDYEFEAKRLPVFYLEAPEVNDGKLKWYSVIFFHEKSTDPEKPKAWIGVFDKASSTALKWVEYPELSTHDPVFEHKASILMVPTPELTPYLSIWVMGRSQASQLGFGPVGPQMHKPSLPFAESLMKIMKEKVPQGQHLEWNQSPDPASTKHPTRWTQLDVDVKDVQKEIWQIEGKAELREKDTADSKKVGECAPGHLAIVIQFLKDDKTKADWRNIACDAWRGFVLKSHLKHVK